MYLVVGLVNWFVSYKLKLTIRWWKSKCGLQLIRRSLMFVDYDLNFKMLKRFVGLD